MRRVVVTSALVLGCHITDLERARFAGSDADLAHCGGDAGVTSFRSDVQPWFTHCKRCHGGRNPEAGLVLDPIVPASQVYAELVNVAPTGDPCRRAGIPGLRRVVPGDLTRSLLFQKISASQPVCGRAMPEDCHGVPLCGIADADTMRSVIGCWIGAGAPNN